MPKRVGLQVALLVIGLLGGWLWGASERSHLDRALQAAELCNDLLEARTSLFAARDGLNHGDLREMSGHLAAARWFAGSAEMRLDKLGWRDEAHLLDLADIGAQIDAAARLGVRLDLETQPGALKATTWRSQDSGFGSHLLTPDPRLPTPDSQLATPVETTAKR